MCLPGMMRVCTARRPVASAVEPRLSQREPVTAGAAIGPGDDHLAFSIFVTVICPLMRSASNLTLSPTFTCLSIARSCTRKTIVILSFMSSFLIGPCLSVILPAASSIFVTWPSTMGAWATVTVANVNERMRMLTAARAILRMVLLLLFRSRALFHGDPPEHALLIVAGNETGELECAALGELPNDLAVAVRQQALCIRIVMLHVRILFHHLRVLAIFSDRSEDELMILLAIVLEDETDLFPSAHLNAGGLVTHLPASLEHLDLDDARGLLGITRPASRETSVILVGGRQTGHCDVHRQHCRSRCQ